MKGILVYLWLVDAAAAGWLACVGLSFLRSDPARRELSYLAIIEVPVQAVLFVGLRHDHRRLRRAASLAILFGVVGWLLGPAVSGSGMITWTLPRRVAFIIAGFNTTLLAFIVPIGALFGMHLETIARFIERKRTTCKSED